MIKILIRGTKNRIDCNFCGAVMSYDKEDIKEEEKFLSQRETYFENYIICPQCKNRIIFKNNFKSDNPYQE